MSIFLNTIDLKNLKLEESGDTKTSWVQVFRLGKWNHPRYGKLQFTDPIFEGFVKNFNDKVRGIDIAIDAEHQPEKGACGWIRQLASRDGGLWALVEWTKWGLQLVSDGVFKYLSGDFDYEWKNEETGKKFKNVLFGAALTNRPFIKGMSPINLSEYVDDVNLKDTFQLAEDILKLKEGVVKTDAELMACQDDSTLTPEEMKRKEELMKQEEVVLCAKKKLAERAKKVNLAETATEEEVVAAEKKLTEQINNENEQRVARAKAVGLPADATLQQIEAEEEKAVTKQREMAKNKELADKAALAARAKAVGLPETATEEEIKKKEDEMAANKMLSDIPSMEKRLSELRDSNGDALTIRLLSENLETRKKLAEEKLASAKAAIENKLKDHWRDGKITAKERSVLQEVLCSDVEGGNTSFQLSEKDKDGKDVKATKTLFEVMDMILSDRPTIVELKELAQKELRTPPKEDSKELSEEEVGKHAARVAGRITKATKSAKKE